VAGRFTAQIIRNTVSPKLGDPPVYGKVVRKLMQDHLEVTLKLAKKKAPRDTGKMADSLKVYMGDGEPPKVGGIRTDSRKARYVHGAFRIPALPRRRTRPHFPPANQSMRAWASRRGVRVGLVQAAIARRGTPIVPFISEAVDELAPVLKTRITQAARDIEKEWGK